MKRFFVDIIILTFASLCTIVAIAFILDIMGWSDWAYRRFTSSGSTSLIVGTSRAAQALQPSIIDENLVNCGYELPMYNFSFTMTSSPYGEVYYKAINKKLSPDTKNGLFIVCVDPWSLGLSSGDKDGLREKGDRLDKILFYTKPNIQYIWKYGERPFTFDNVMCLHDDGWLEVSVPMDSISVEERINRKKEEYKTETLVRSEYRIDWLKKIIQLVKDHGTVVLCRIPAHPYFMEMENRFWPEFESEMCDISTEYGVPYFSFISSNQSYRTIDGNHIYKEDGARFTEDLCDSIKRRIVFSGQ